MAAVPIPIQSAPGVKRDGTRLDRETYIDAQWCRFQRGRPQKIGGYRGVTSTVPEITRGMALASLNSIQYAHLGGATTLTQVQMDNQGLLAAQNARIPAGFTGSIENLWQFDLLYVTAGATLNLIAHAAPNATDISSQVERPIYYGSVSGTGVLTNTTIASQSGGIVVLAPYLLTYGNSGRVDICNANNPTVVVNTVFATGQKIVKGLPLRGGGTGPSGILWSLDSVIRATFTSSGAGYFAFDTVSSESSILSSQGVIEYDGTFYWAGVDRFLMFNGVVRDIPNESNHNWFYRNLNFAARQKVFAFKVPEFGEIWWCYPRGSATECTHAVIYHVPSGTWYDTQLPNSGRSAGVFAKVYQKPFMVDLDATGSGYTMWQHETGTDYILGTDVQPVQSYFETNELSMLSSGQPSDGQLSVVRVEPDFVQSGPMTLIVKGRENSRAPVTSSETFTFPDTAPSSDDEVIRTKETRRLMSFRFESNVAGGNYELGKTYGFVEPNGKRFAS